MTAQEFIKFTETEKLKLLQEKGKLLTELADVISSYRLYVINNFHVEVRKGIVNETFPSIIVHHG